MHKRPIAALLIAIILIPALAVADEGTGVSAAESIEDYVCDPAYVNHIIENNSADIIKPGHSGNLVFRLSNPYNRSMENVSLLAEIYAVADIDYYKEIGPATPHAPEFVQGDGLLYSTHVSRMYPGYNLTYRLLISTDENTPEGIYYVRFKIEFDYSNSSNGTYHHFVMRSLSYYTREQIEYARRNATESDLPYYRHGINMSYLNGILPIDAVIRYTSFSVKSGIPLWPAALLAGFAVFFGVLSYMYYMNDNYGKYRWLDEKTKQMSGKYQKFRRGLYERARKK